MSKPLDTKEFIRRAKEIHGNKFGYDKVDYVNSYTKVKIKCKIHGWFHQIPSTHIDSCGCTKCGIELRAERKRKTTQKFIKDARKVHGKTYGYDKVDYIGSHTKVKIECKIHGFFDMAPTNHLFNNNGCKKCAYKRNIKLQRKTKQQFIKEARRVHGKTYGYDKAKYLNNKIPLKIKCKIKGHGFFDQAPTHHIHRGQGCHKCVDLKNSKGVQTIELFLKQKKIKYERERRFPDLRDKRYLPLDFWLPKLKIAIEFDGEQHSRIGIFSATKEKLRSIQKRDRIKNKWAKKHRYTMIRISYIQLNNINEILSKDVA